MSTLAERLKLAIEAEGRSGQWLETITAHLPGEAKWPRGYASYVLKGERKRIGAEKIRSAADALNVRYDWLQFATGPMREPAIAPAARTVVSVFRRENLETAMARKGLDEERATEFRLQAAAEPGGADASVETWKSRIDEWRARGKGKAVPAPDHDDEREAADVAAFRAAKTKPKKK